MHDAELLQISLQHCPGATLPVICNTLDRLPPAVHIKPWTLALHTCNIHCHSNGITPGGTVQHVTSFHAALGASAFNHCSAAVVQPQHS
jgi:hypothetical protein